MPQIRRAGVAIVSSVLIFALFGTAFCIPIRLRSGTIDSPKKETISTTEATPSLSSAYYIVQFEGPVQDKWKQLLLALDVRLLDYIPDNAFTAKMRPEQARSVRKLDIVRWVGRIAPRDRVDPSILKRKDAQVEVIIRLFPGETSAEVKKGIRSLGGKLHISAAPAKGYVRASVPQAALDALSKIEGVAWIEQWSSPRAANNVAQGIAGVPEMRRQLSLYGAGQVMAFADSGLDTGNQSTLSPDFAGRILQTYGIRRPGVWSDQSGHGTHAIGVAVGSGVLSGANPASHSYSGSFAGIAPEAGIVIQSIGDSSPYVYPPLDLSTLFQPAYDDGARVHSDSWGTSTAGLYTTYSQQVDDFAWNHKDMVMVFPSGNDAVDHNSDGVTDSGSMYAPGTAKNCITVGATESVRSTGRITTYGAAWPADFPAEPIFGDLISDNSRGMVAWSGRGPCSDGRIKPDICAPGTNIISCKSQSAASVGWGLYDQHYMYWGGTSMSTPMVAGAAALVREHFVDDEGIQPSAALVKAVLINGATDISPGQYGPPYAPEVSLRPNNSEGWGLLNVSDSLAPIAPRVVDYVDETIGVSAGDTRHYTYSVVSGGMPLAVTLVWTDPPPALQAAKQLVNDLNLTVADPTGHAYLGNGHVDDTNNVEGVDIPAPIAGTYTLSVAAASVPVGPQPFALVVSGALPGSYIAGLARTASGNPISGVTVTFDLEGHSRTTATGSNGNYTLSLAPGTYTVTPSKTGWTFDPASASVTIASSGVQGVSFTGSALSGNITGTVSQALGGKVGYILESPHPYYNNMDTTYVISARPEATRIRVHFDQMSLEDGSDFVQVEDTGGQAVDQITGEQSNRWSQWVTGNAAKIELITDGSNNDWGFHIDSYETDASVQGGLQGVAISTVPLSAGAVTSQNGTFALQSLDPVAYSITPSMSHWQFAPSVLSGEVPIGGTLSSVDFQGFSPGSVSGTVTTGTVIKSSCNVRSDHPYSPNSLITMEVHATTGASRMRVHFSQIETEEGFDFVYVTDSSGNVVDSFTGSYSTPTWSSWVSGDVLRIILQSDDSVQMYGFACDQMAEVRDEHGLAGVTVQMQGATTTVTGEDGTYTAPQVDTGYSSITVAKPTWTFDPGARSVNVVSGLTTSNVDFFGQTSSTPAVGYTKSLQDGKPVALKGCIVTAGNDELSGCFYIEDPNRFSAIKVAWTGSAISERNVVDITGVMGTADGERQILATSVDVTSEEGPVIHPLEFNGRCLGGGSQYGCTPGVRNGTGLNNIGCLVRCWGRVTAIGSDYIYLDDGSILKDGSSTGGVQNVGVKVMCDPAGLAVRDFIPINGICSCFTAPNGIAPRILTRTTADVN